MPHAHKYFNDHDFYIADVTHLFASSQKISSHSDKVWRGQGVKSDKKMIKNWLQLDVLIALHPGKPSKSFQISFGCKLINSSGALTDVF